MADSGDTSSRSSEDSVVANDTRGKKRPADTSADSFNSNTCNKKQATFACSPTTSVDGDVSSDASIDNNRPLASSAGFQLRPSILSSCKPPTSPPITSSPSGPKVSSPPVVVGKSPPAKVCGFQLRPSSLGNDLMMKPQCNIPNSVPAINPLFTLAVENSEFLDGPQEIRFRDKSRVPPVSRDTSNDSMKPPEDSVLTHPKEDTQSQDKCSEQPEVTNTPSGDTAVSATTSITPNGSPSAPTNAASTLPFTDHPDCLATAAPSSVNTESLTPGFVFGENLCERALSTQPTTTPSFAQSEKKDPPVLEDRVVLTGEEADVNVLQINSKLWMFQPDSKLWLERGNVMLKLNDFQAEGKSAISRLIARCQGTLRVCLNTQLFPQMVLERAGKAGLRIAANTEEGVRIFLVKGSIKDISNLEDALSSRLLGLNNCSQS